MEESEKKWIGILIAALICGIVFGKIMSILLGMILHGGNWALLTDSMIPIFSLIAVLVVAFFHQKEKERTIE